MRNEHVVLHPHVGSTFTPLSSSYSYGGMIGSDLNDVNNEQKNTFVRRLRGESVNIDFTQAHIRDAYVKKK
jgi:hypothetical protein